MLSEMAAKYPVIEETFREASAALGYDLWALTQQGPAEELNKTWQTQPALLTASVALWRVWQQQGGKAPALLAGHSLVNTLRWCVPVLSRLLTRCVWLNCAVSSCRKQYLKAPVACLLSSASMTLRLQKRVKNPLKVRWCLPLTSTRQSRGYRRS